MRAWPKEELALRRRAVRFEGEDELEEEAILWTRFVDDKKV